ncbi:MAG TPA: 3-dehydroquinate synthase [Pyrinomonadaceae bacterium]|nr:3-dehydroquinate synthase [Pyrinomonadaceae bacterium]
MSSDEGLRSVPVRLKGGAGYEVRVGSGLLARLGEFAREGLGGRARRTALISNARVFGLYGGEAVRGLRGAGFEVSSWLMGEGERFKTLRTAERALTFLSETKLERGDAVVALGGGVVGDLAGFASALYLRGVAFVQAPTTLLAQIDSSVGGKTGVNTSAGKNLVGAFHQPRAVVVDTRTLRTLPARELTAGWCEAVKQGAVGDRRLFERTRNFLAMGTRAEEFEREDELASIIAAQCAFKARIVAGDERESVSRTDARSRRVLNFGHTVGHALEAVTAYRRFRHGEAVGYGMLAAGEISVRLGLLDAAELEYLRDAVRLAGRLPRASDLDAAALARALRGDKKSVGGHVQWVLLERLGRARIVDGREVPGRAVVESIRAVLR